MPDTAQDLKGAGTFVWDGHFGGMSADLECRLMVLAAESKSDSRVLPNIMGLACLGLRHEVDVELRVTADVEGGAVRIAMGIDCAQNGKRVAIDIR